MQSVLMDKMKNNQILTVPQKIFQMRCVDQKYNQEKDFKKPAYSNNEGNQQLWGKKHFKGVVDYDLTFLTSVSV